MKRLKFAGLLFFVIQMLFSVGASAQSADKLYAEGKKLYDEKNYEAALPKLLAAAEKGHRKAQYRVGRCYDKGNGTAEDDVKAVEWYGKSAAQGFAKAQYQLGKCYKNGEGVEKDRKKAVELFMKAAKQENADAELALGKAYLKGKGIAEDKSQAKKWLSRALSNPKGGKELLEEVRAEASAGDADAKTILALTGKK